LHVEYAGSHGPRILLVHGSLAPGWSTWQGQRPLAGAHRLVVPYRGGYPPNPPLERIDFEVQAAEIAELIEPGTHVVGHSYGGVISLLAAGMRTDAVASFTVIEPPAFGIAADHPVVAAMIERLQEVFADPQRPARDFLVDFAAAVGSTAPVPEALSPTLQASVRATRVERPPWEAVFPYGRVREAGFPILVVSGAHSAAYDVVCDVLERELSADRAVIQGAGHAAQRVGDAFNARLLRHLAAARS
jgi:pimeloyl-ACP methyl ester carboxylesterase